MDDEDDDETLVGTSPPVGSDLLEGFWEVKMLAARWAERERIMDTRRKREARASSDEGGCGR